MNCPKRCRTVTHSSGKWTVSLGADGTASQPWSAGLETRHSIDLEALSHHKGIPLVRRDPGDGSRTPQEAAGVHVRYPEM